MPQTYVYDSDSQQHLCKSAITDVGLDMPDQGMVPDGAKCGEEKVIHNRGDKWRLSWCNGLFILPRIQVSTRMWMRNLMATLYYAEHVHIVQISIKTEIPKRYRTPFWDGHLYPDLDPSPCPVM